ncbi:gliding motility protein [Streptomyces sp. NPDC051109]|uniref:gliding motility protein n=1 Tax=Streptomyces sp. NPDC051109 TaxID=3365642 RepID=UPI0010653585
MGVFSRFRRKVAEARTEEAAAATVTAESEAAVVENEAETGVEAGSAEPEGAAPEGVEIPKQQSAEKAADSEAGEGARK